MAKTPSHVGRLLGRVAANEEAATVWCAECCAQLLLEEASKLGSRTEKGLLLGSLAERIRKGDWKRVAREEGLRPADFAKQNIGSL